MARGDGTENTVETFLGKKERCLSFGHQQGVRDGSSDVREAEGGEGSCIHYSPSLHKQGGEVALAESSTAAPRGRDPGRETVRSCREGVFGIHTASHPQGTGVFIQPGLGCGLVSSVQQLC